MVPFIPRLLSVDELEKIHAVHNCNRAGFIEAEHKGYASDVYAHVFWVQIEEPIPEEFRYTIRRVWVYLGRNGLELEFRAEPDHRTNDKADLELKWDELRHGIIDENHAEEAEEIVSKVKGEGSEDGEDDDLGDGDDEEDDGDDRGGGAVATRRV